MARLSILPGSLVEHPISEWIQVQIGNNKLSAGSNESEIHYPDYLVYHENYDEEREINAIGLIHLKRNIVFGKNKAAINLSSCTSFQVGIPANFFSWGSTEMNGTLSDDLRVIALRIIGEKTCKLAWNSPINDSQICVISAPGTGPCFGNLGGPLVFEEKIIAIASHARTCATGKPEVFTRLVAYRDWIANKTGIKNIGQI